jgi:hypothetical protein
MRNKVLKVMRGLSPNPKKLGRDGDDGIFIYASPATVYRVVAETVQQMQATDVDDLAALAAQDGYRDVQFGFTVQGQRVAVHTCYESD